MSQDESAPPSNPLSGGFSRVVVTDDNKAALIAKAAAAGKNYQREEAAIENSPPRRAIPSKQKAAVGTPPSPAVRAESTSGRTLTGPEIKADSHVFVGSQEVPLSLALSLGWITRDGNGDIHATPKGRAAGGLDAKADLPAAASTQPDRTQDRTQENDPDNPDNDSDNTSDLPQTSQAAWAEVAEQIQDIPQAAFNEAQAAYLSESGTTIEAVAEMLGESVEDAAPRVAAMEHAMRMQGNEVLAAAGVHEPDAFIGYATAEPQLGEFRSAVQAQARGDTVPLSRMAAGYRRAVADLAASGRLAGHDGSYTLDDGTSAKIFTKNGKSYYQAGTLAAVPLADAVLAGAVNLKNR